MQRIVRKMNQALPKNSVYVGVGSKYENPFKVGLEMDQDESFYRYKQYLSEGIKSGKIDLKPLYGKDLVCWCKRDLILEYFDEN